MSWLLCRFPPKEPEFLDYFFTVLGRSMYVANSFESKCRELLGFVRFANACDATGDFDAAIELMAAMKQKMLAGTIAEMGTAVQIKPQDIDTLARAKDARNLIAHEGGQIGHIWDASRQDLAAQLEKLRVVAVALSKGDNLVSRWQHEISEKKSAPIGMSEFYPPALEDWIFGGAATLDAGRLYYERRLAGQPS